MATNEENVKKVLKDNFEEAVIDVVQIDFIELKMAALKYVHFLLQLEQEFRNIEHQAKLGEDSKATVETIMKNIATQMSRSDVKVQQIFEENFAFRNALDKFLGRKIPLVLMNQDGSVLALDETQEKQLYTNYLSKNTSGRGRMKNLEDALASLNIVESELSKALNLRLQNFKGVFQEAKRRANKPEDPEEGMRYSPSARTFYYRLYDHHVTGWSKQLSNADISEVYAKVILNRLYTNENQEYILQTMAEEYTGHDWIRAIEKGDIEINTTETGNVNLSLALKYGNTFQTEGIRQYILAAFNISIIENISKEQLSSILVRLSNMYSPKSVTRIVEAAGGKVEKEIKEKLPKSSISFLLG